MLELVNIDPTDRGRSAALILDAWDKNLVLHLRPKAGLDDVHAFYDALLPQIGTPHFLAEDVRQGGREVQRTGQLWMEVRYDPNFTDAYRHSPNAQPLHTDGSYIAAYPNATLMCCVSSASDGGETIFVRAEDLVDALRAEAPELLAELQQMPMPHARSGDRRSYPVIRSDGGRPLLNWNYYCVAPDASADVMALRQRFFDFLRDSPRVRAGIRAVKLVPGDAVVWKDETVLHGRNAFNATEVSERFLWKCAIDVGVFSELKKSRVEAATIRGA